MIRELITEYRRELRGKQRAFTLVELCIIIVIIAMLIVLLLPIFGTVMKKSRAAACAQQLRSISTLLHGVAAEQNGKLTFFRDGNDLGELRWYTQMRQYAGMSAKWAQKAFGCPSLPSDKVDDWRCYGLRVSGAPGKVVRDTESTKKAGIYQLSLPSVAEPSKFLIMADTIASNGLQSFRIIPPKLYDGGGIHLRHFDRANALFLDGHVNALSAADLYAAGIEEVIDKKGESLRTKPGLY